jgi:hypothetical protein
MWWPSPKAFDQLEVTETETGFEFSAPDDSECGNWLSYFSQTEELHQEFEQEILNCIRNYIENLNGESEISDGREDRHPSQEENGAGKDAAH